MKQLLMSFLFFLLYNYNYCTSKHTLIQEIDSLEYYYTLANNPKTNSSLIDAYIFFNKKAVESLVSKDTLSAIHHLRQVSIIQTNIGDYYGSETNAVKALNLLENINSTNLKTENKIGIYNQLGRIYTELLDLKMAMKYYNEALKITTDPSKINIIRNNIGLIYIQQSDYEKAEKEFLENYQMSAPLSDMKQTARALNNLGFVQFKLNREDALDNLNQALQLRIDIEDVPGIYSSYKNLFLFYQNKKDIEAATFYADKAYQTAKSLNSASFIEDALSNIISLSSDSKISEYKKLKDSITQAKQIAENKYALIKYNYLEQEQIANENMLQKEKEKSNRILFQALGVLVTSISIFLILIIKSKHKKDKIQVVFNTETRISKKVHDEVANDIYHAMTKLQNNSNNNEDLLDDLEKIYNRTRDISKGISGINVKTNFNDLLYDLLISYKSNEVSVIANNLSKMDWKGIDHIKRATIYRVLQELMTNMRKHSKASIVLISFNQTQKKLTIDYKDNGVGCNLLKNNGLLNAENRMASINGSITFESESNNGFKAKIVV